MLAPPLEHSFVLALSGIASMDMAMPAIIAAGRGGWQYVSRRWPAATRISYSTSGPASLRSAGLAQGHSRLWAGSHAKAADVLTDCNPALSALQGAWYNVFDIKDTDRSTPVSLRLSCVLILWTKKSRWLNRTSSRIL